MAEMTHMRRTLTVGASPDAVFSRWRDPEVLRQVMAHVAEVEPEGPDRARWLVRPGRGPEIEWTTEVVEADAGAGRLRWRSVDGSMASTGEVLVREAPNQLGSEVTLDLTLDPSDGPLDAVPGAVVDGVAGAVAATALRRFKSLVETGEIPTLEHNPTADGHDGRD